MVAAFLQAEIDSSRWREYILPRLTRLQLTQDMLRSPDVTDSMQNARRSDLLGIFRGWRRDTFLFKGWPKGLEWSVVALCKDDLTNVFYAQAGEWGSLSRDTFRLTDGANRIKGGDPTIPSDVPVATIRDIAEAMRQGSAFPLTIAIGSTDGERIVMVEGHARMTAHAIAGGKREIEILLGSGPMETVRSWPYCPPEYIRPAEG